MGVPEKLAQQASAQLGAAVLAASMVVPPGATLYRSYSPSSKVLGGGGAIGAAIASKVGDQASGMAGSVPRQMGVLAVTADEVVFCKKKMLGVGCGARIAAWPREDVTMTFEAPEKWSYPGVLITFTDGSVCAVFAEKRWGLDALANAVNS
jgi:hypothetical protein